MKEINDGGRAFPRAALDVWGKTVDKHSGMTLRDYFAAKAMQGMLSGKAGDDFVNRVGAGCLIAYEIADAMIAEGSR